MQYLTAADDFGLTFTPIPTDDEIKALVAAYAKRPGVRARWADDQALIERTRVLVG